MSGRTITYEVCELVTYSRTITVPQDAQAADIEAAAEADWVESGDPVKDMQSVDERFVHGWREGAA